MGDVTIERFITGPLETNTYVVTAAEGRDTIIVDPSSGCGRIIAHCDSAKLDITAIVLTHGHFDHILGIPEIHARTNVPVYVHPSDRVLVCQSGMNGSDIMGESFFYGGPLSDLQEGDMAFGAISTRVLHVPGHSPGGVAFLFGKQVLVGDSLFAGSIGRADLPGGDYELLVRGIREKLLSLPPETVVWPGHGNRTTIGREVRMNPFFT